MYPRLIQLPKQSFFLFGPRGTGKSMWLSQALPDALVIDLLRSSAYLAYQRDPSLLAREAAALEPDSWIVIDEVQKLPELLDEVHALLFANPQGHRFALSGSSARKLRKSNANMLAGRVWSKRMFPLSPLEMGEDFRLEEALRYGQLPLSATAASTADRIEFLDAYVETYLREEIRQEALVRSLDRFHRFLSVAALASGQVLNISNVARDVGVARSTVQGYFGILEDTLLGWQLPAWRKRAKVKEVAHSKFYLFDCGVQRALAGLHRDKPSSAERGALFETWLLNEFRALNAWSAQGAEFFYWRTEAGTEVDLIWKRGGRAVGIQIKASRNWKEPFNKGLRTLLQAGGIDQAFGVYTGERELKFDEIRVLPYQSALEKAWAGEFSTG
ncbi:MAG: DUF4143 domain-containing protein [Gammaproteobacteria bacterium]|nr:DUF4143 domain-containing protein [Gammaproteobacteria bacterium]